MAHGFLYNKTYKGRFSGHETFPLRQLWLTKAYKAVSEQNGICPKHIFREKEAIVQFGVGINMAKSIHHWSHACSILNTTDKGIECTKLGDFLFGNKGLDKYSEYDATPWLVHWMLAGNGENRAARTTTWAWLFNYVTQSTFDKKHIHETLSAYLIERGQEVSSKSIATDIDVCLRSYAPRQLQTTPEDASEPILGELGLIVPDTKNAYRFNRGPKDTLPAGLFGFALLDFWDEHSPDVNTLSFDTISHEHGSPGRVFKLDENSISDYILELETITNEKIIWSDSAGVRQVIRKPNYPDKYSLLEKAYG